MNGSICTIWIDPAGIYLFKVNNGNTRAMCESCSKLKVKTPERRQWSHSGVFIVNFEQISHIVLVFPLLVLNKSMPARECVCWCCFVALLYFGWTSTLWIWFIRFWEILSENIFFQKWSELIKIVTNIHVWFQVL